MKVFPIVLYIFVKITRVLIFFIKIKFSIVYLRLSYEIGQRFFSQMNSTKSTQWRRKKNRRHRWVFFFCSGDKPANFFAGMNTIRTLFAKFCWDRSGNWIAESKKSTCQVILLSSLYFLFVIIKFQVFKFPQPQKKSMKTLVTKLLTFFS